MKASSNISSIQKTIFFVLGMLVAVFVVSQEVIDYHCSKLSAEVEEQQSSEEEKQETEVGMLSLNVVLPGSAITLEPFIPVFIREIVLDQEVDTPVPQNIPLENTPYFKTLFRQIISPNAP